MPNEDPKLIIAKTLGTDLDWGDGMQPIRNPGIVRRRLIQAALLIGIITLPAAVALLLWAALKPLF